jgi:hypothetical protein
LAKLRESTTVLTKEPLANGGNKNGFSKKTVGKTTNQQRFFLENRWKWF